MINSQDLCARARANVKEIDVHTLQQKLPKVPE